MSPSWFWKQAGWKNILVGAAFTVGGLATTGVIQIGVDKYLRNHLFFKRNELAVDATRIALKGIGGTAVTFAISKITRNDTWARQHQAGVYIGLGLDTVGTVWKWVNRLVSKAKLTQGAVVPPLTGTNIGLNLLGLGSLNQAYGESKLMAALSTDGEVTIASDVNTGDIALLNAKGEVLVQGEKQVMGEFLDGLRGADVSVSGESSEGVGEDITVES